MGLIRLFLALSVASAHTQIKIFNQIPFEGNGAVSVSSFLVISGFYMALVLDQKYLDKPMGILRFYGNRLLRIYPAYLICIFLSFVLALHTDATSITFWTQSMSDFYSRFLTLSTSSKLLVELANFGIIGTNYLISAGFTADGTLTTNMGQPGVIAAHSFLLFPPGWTLAIELTFYAIAPFLMLWRKADSLPVTLCFIAPPSILYFIAPGPTLSPGLSFCLAGMLSYFIYKKIKISPNYLIVTAGRYLPIVIVSFLLLANYLPGTTYMRMWVFIALIWTSIPFIFVATSQYRWDRLIGELSYPLYIAHFLVYKFLAYYLPAHLQLLYFPCLLMFATIILFTIDMPIDRWRNNKGKYKVNSEVISDNDNIRPVIA